MNPDPCQNKNGSGSAQSVADSQHCAVPNFTFVNFNVFGGELSGLRICIVQMRTYPGSALRICRKADHGSGYRILGPGLKPRRPFFKISIQF